MALKVTQIRSASGSTDRQRKTLTGLGLGRIGKTRVLEDTPSIRGMVEKVKHLVNVEEAQQ
jgi:large subunit ribosomal protein L30